MDAEQAGRDMTTKQAGRDMITKSVNMEDFRQADEYQMNASVFNNNVTKDELIERYKTWTNTGGYEQILTTCYLAPNRSADIVIKKLDGNPNLRILDCGAGTGYLGELLAKKGFKNIDALEPVSDMADVARKRNVYKNIHMDFIDAGSSPFDENTYDALVCVGAIGPGHIPVNAISEMIRVVKPGGFIFMSVREEYLKEEFSDMEPFLKKCEDDGLWKRCDRVVYPGHFFDLNGVCLIYQVL